MRIFDRLRNRTAAFAHDLLMVPVAWLGAHWLRFNLEQVPDVILDRALAMLPVMVIVQGAVFWYFGLYRGVWRFASVPDLVRILKAVLVGVSLCALSVFLLTRMQDVPRSVFPLHGLLLVLLLGGPRLVYRWGKDRTLYDRPVSRVLVVGAGESGEMLVRDLLREGSYLPVAFVDDDVTKKGREIHGVRVLGASEKIPRLVQRLSVDLVLLAVPGATANAMRRIVALCDEVGVAVRTLPATQDLVRGRVSVRELREISIDDLLGRAPVSLDWDAIARGVAGRVVLVSGGGGSIGSELCRQLARLGPRSLVVLDAAEFNLFRIEQELRGAHPALALHPVLGNVRDEAMLERVMRRHRPEVVFHAAAYKHVPMLELHVLEAVRNNVLGTRAVARAAVRHDVERFVLISTDKAVNPSNVMGQTKRAAELVCLAMSRRHPGTRFITVRFGNVLDSAGSVVPTFRGQIAAGGPVTVTHPEMRRFFMTIPEACQLILQAAAAGKGGELFVLDMGEPVRIAYLAEQMIRLAGKVPGEDIEITYVGLRPGEKLDEELFHADEARQPTPHEKLLLARQRDFDPDRLEQAVAALEAACGRDDEAELRRLLAAAVAVAAGGDGGRAKVIPLGSGAAR
ncbi:MAG: polysaccharide biosynthesis protein [Ectothiorhodospiraceae bacterium]|nr:polysaccharide biosynthesis protein [Ectothiorhodospiraceae bacterium]